MEEGVAPGFRSPQYRPKSIFSSHFVSGRRKLHYKGRPSQLRFPDLDSPPVGLHYLGGYGQAEAAAAGVLRARAVDTIEALEYPLALILGDAGARVLDRDADQCPGLVAGRSPGRSLTAALGLYLMAFEMRL